MWNKVYTKNSYPDTNLSAAQSKIEFTINNGDVPISRNIKYFIQVETNENKLINNPIPFLFHRIELKVNNNLVDEVENPGVASTMFLAASTSSSNINRVKNGGYTPGGTTSFNTSKVYSFTGTLNNFGLGFLEDGGDFLLNTEVKVIFLKNSSTIDCFRKASTSGEDSSENEVVTASSSGSKQTPPAPTIVIKNFYLKTTFFDPSIEQKISLIPGLLTTNQTYVFRKLQLIQKNGINGSSFVTDVTNLYQGSNTPQFILLSFQDGRDGTTKDSSIFDHCNVKNIQVKIGGELYPQERQDLNFASKMVTEAYDSFCEYNVSKGDNEPSLSPSEWFESPIFVVDTLNQPLSYTNMKKNIVVQVDFTSPVTSSNVVMNLLMVTLTKIEHNKENNTFIVDPSY
jgi:hypothetical protein